MPAKLIDGRQIALDVRSEVANGVQDLLSQTGITPGLAAVLVGDDPASAIYVRNKGRACDEAGIFSQIFHMPASMAQAELIELISTLNHDPKFHGILVQLPLPPQIDERSAILAIDPEKDVDGLHPVNAGKLMEGRPKFAPATPSGIREIMLRSGIDPSGKHAVILGRSNIVGKPLAAMLMQKAEGANATVTICHTGTPDVGIYTRQADILIVAVGRAKSVTANMVGKGAVIIDVGINRIEDSTTKSGTRLVGDVDFESVVDKVAMITPVPGGVGPMTIAMLLSNTLLAARYSAGVVSTT